MEYNDIREQVAKALPHATDDEVTVAAEGIYHAKRLGVEGSEGTVKEMAEQFYAVLEDTKAHGVNPGRKAAMEEITAMLDEEIQLVWASIQGKKCTPLELFVQGCNILGHIVATEAALNAELAHMLTLIEVSSDDEEVALKQLEGISRRMRALAATVVAINMDAAAKEGKVWNPKQTE